MTSDLERTYYRRRAEQERVASTKADPHVARLHAELAERYALLAQEDVVERRDAMAG